MDTKNITKALIQFRQLVGKVSKNSENPYFKSKYGDLNSYLEVITEPLATCGLAIVQMPITNGLQTMLLHESGEHLESECTIPGLTADPQKLGAAITYLRRYMIASFLCLNAEDDDGESVVRGSDMPNKKVPQKDLVDLERQSTFIIKGQIREFISDIPDLGEKEQGFISKLDTFGLQALKNGLEKLKATYKK